MIDPAIWYTINDRGNGRASIIQSKGKVGKY